MFGYILLDILIFTNDDQWMNQLKCSKINKFKTNWNVQNIIMTEHKNEPIWSMSHYYLQANAKMMWIYFKR